MSRERFATEIQKLLAMSNPDDREDQTKVLSEMYDRLHEELDDLGRALLTINDCPEMRRVFREFALEVLRIRYTVGGEKTTNEKKSELLIRSWP